MRPLYLAVALAILLALAVLPTSAYTQDGGPASSISAIRRDLPLLLAAPLQDVRVGPTVDWVVADDHEAVAMWHAGKNRGLVALRLRSRKWWWRGAAVKTMYNSVAPWTRMRMPGIDLEDCDSLTFPDPPSANTLFEEGFIGRTLARELSSRLPATHTSNIVGGSTCTRDPQYLVSTTGGSEATFFHHEEYLPTWFTWMGQTAADQEGETGSTWDARYSFTLAARRDNREEGMQRLVHSTLKPLFDELLPTPPPTLAFSPNSTINVWFPYVLAKQDHDVLSISNVTPEIAGVPGTLRNNELHFVLPAFTLHWGDVAEGEIKTVQVSPNPTPHRHPLFRRKIRHQ